MFALGDVMSARGAAFSPVLWHTGDFREALALEPARAVSSWPRQALASAEPKG